jgi:hypothetical protein
MLERWSKPHCSYPKQVAARQQSQANTENCQRPSRHTEPFDISRFIHQIKRTRQQFLKNVLAGGAPQLTYSIFSNPIHENASTTKVFQNKSPSLGLGGGKGFCFVNMKEEDHSFKSERCLNRSSPIPR